MKLTIFFLTVGILNVAAKGVSQTVTFSGDNVPLKTVFSLVEKQTGFVFFYKQGLLQDTKPVTINVTNTPLVEFLDEVLKNEPLDYSIKNNNVIIRRKREATDDINRRLSEDNFSRLNNPPLTGIIRDAEGNPIAGANIVIKGTKKGVTTDANGKFSIEANANDVLIISSIGFNVKEVRINSINAALTVVLEKSVSKLDEVQVIAYGTTSERLSTGNIGTVKAKDIEKQPVNNPLLALQGRVPGLFIEQGSGFAGTSVKVRIQGTNSMINGNDPLYVVDGIPFTSQLLNSDNPILKGIGAAGLGESGGSPLNFINPADIESIDVLKDADATAIYGSRAANGAILITTKRGKVGDVKINVNLQSGWGKVTRKLDLMNAEQYLEMRREAFANDGLTPQLFDYDLNGDWDSTRSTDWQKELIGGTARYNDIQTSVSGGNSNTQFLVGATYHKETNVFPGDFSDTKNSVHFNINTTSPNQKFKMQTSGFYLVDDNRLPQTDLTNLAMTLAPVAPALYKADGTINWEPNTAGRSTFLNNPMAKLFNNFKNKTANLTGNTILSYEILKGLALKSSFGYNSLQSDVISSSFPSRIPPEYQIYATRSTLFSNSRMSSWSVEPQLTFTHAVSKGRIEMLLGSTIQEENRDASSITASGFNTDQVMEDIKSAALLAAGASENSVYRYNALFGRINYNLGNKYILNLTGRRDGSSRFGSENQFHNFGAIGAAWIFSEENWVQNNVKFLSFGKLRGSYGTTGNDKISDYRFLSLYDAVPYADAPYQGAIGYQPNGLTNPYLQWEETKKLQIGLDLGFLGNRILLNTNYSMNQSSNQLLGLGLPATAGFSSIPANLPATLQNSGWELTLSASNIVIRQFKWSGSINITLPKNKVSSFPDMKDLGYDLIIGKSINILRVYPFAGVDPESGIFQFRDQNGAITSSPVYGTDNTVILNSDPKFYGGFQNTITYKGFQLDFLFSFVKQIGANYFLGFGTPGQFNMGTYNQPTWGTDRWQKIGDVVSRQKYTTGYSIGGTASTAASSDAVWSDASYIRLKNLSVSWQLPEKWRKAARLYNLRLYMHGQNLLTFTNYLGLDPETKSSLSLPPLRVLTFGIQAEL